MKLSFLGSKNKKDKFLVLDIGTEAVKALIFKTVLLGKKEHNFFTPSIDKKIVILGACTEYFERYSVFDGKDFEANVIKRAISKAIEGAYQGFILFSKKKKTNIQKQDWKKLPLLVGLPPNILKGRVARYSFRRKNPKEKISKNEQRLILQEVFNEVQKEISQKFTREFGILLEDIQWLVQKIIEIKIDGYSISGIQGYEGKDLEFKILTTFLPKYYSESIKRIFDQLQLKVLKIVHIAEKLPAIWGDKKINGIFFDIGGETTQIFLVKKGSLQQINEFKDGGKAFSQELSGTLGINEKPARILKERYAKGLLSPGSKKRIKEIFLQEKRAWYENLKLKIKETHPKGVPPLNSFLFGGGSLLPEIKESLKETSANNLSDLPEVKFIYPKNLENIEDPAKILKSPQDIPPLLIAQ